MKDAFNTLVKDFVQAGRYAAAQQHTVTRSYKSDGSVLTRIDTELDARLTRRISELFPESSIISEENPVPFKKNSSWIFTLDPIDGTDSFSQGMPGWCVASGILDSTLTPVGAIIYAPLWGTEQGNLLTLFPGDQLLLNGKPFTAAGGENDSSFQIMASSNIHRHFDYRTFKGKIRNTGSGVINLAGTLLHSSVRGALLTPCYIWDMAASHAVLTHAGLSMEYLDKKKIDYEYLAERKKAEGCIAAGSKEAIDTIRASFTPL